MMSSRKRQLEDKDSSPPPNKKTKLNLLNKHSVDKITDEFEDYSDEVWNHPSLLQYIANANSNSQNNKVTTTTNTKHELHDADVNNAMQAKIKNANISEYDYYDGCGPCVNMAGLISDYIDSGLTQYGGGICWEYQQHGMCMQGSDCEFEHVDFASSRPISQIRIPFGKHLGKYLHEIPISYAVWMKKNKVLKQKPDAFVKEVKRVWYDINWNGKSKKKKKKKKKK
eukprot:124159_1